MRNQKKPFKKVLLFIVFLSWVVDLIILWIWISKAESKAELSHFDLTLMFKRVWT